MLILLSLIPELCGISTLRITMLLSLRCIPRCTNVNSPRLQGIGLLLTRPCLAAMESGVNMQLFLAGCVWPCLLARAAASNWQITASLFSGITLGWWARGRFGAPAATTSVPIASSASPAGGFAVSNASSAEERWPRRGRPPCRCPCGCARLPSRRFPCRLGDRGCGALIGPGCCAYPEGVVGRDDGLCCHCAEPNPQEPAVALA